MAWNSLWRLLAAFSGLLMVVVAIWSAVMLGSLDPFWPILLVAWPVVGGLLVAKNPDHPIGKLMILFSVFFSVSTGAESYVYVSLAGPTLPATTVLAWLSVWAITPVITIVLYMVALFPTGRLASTWLRWPLRLSLVMTVIGLVGRAVLPVKMATTEGASFINPWGVEDLAWLVPIEEAGFSIVIVFLAVAVVDLIVRWRRSEGVERLQMRTLTLTLAFFVFAVGVSSLLTLADLPESTQNTIETLAWVPGLAAQPLAIGVAVLRYRLYEIDRFVSRTFTYALLVAVLAAVFFGGVSLLTTRLPVESDLAVAASTLAVAALFNPLRRRIQRWMDTRFNRAHYDGAKVVEEFVGSLRDEIHLDAVVEGWVGVVDDTMQPSVVGVWIRDASPESDAPGLPPPPSQGARLR